MAPPERPDFCWTGRRLEPVLDATEDCGWEVTVCVTIAPEMVTTWTLVTGDGWVSEVLLEVGTMTGTTAVLEELDVEDEEEVVAGVYARDVSVLVAAAGILAA